MSEFPNINMRVDTTKLEEGLARAVEMLAAINLRLLSIQHQLPKKKLKIDNIAPKPDVDEHFCEHCQKYTNHICRYSHHERDSSGDYRDCLECRWYCVGGSEYQPPLTP